MSGVLAFHLSALVINEAPEMIVEQTVNTPIIRRTFYKSNLLFPSCVGAKPPEVESGSSRKERRKCPDLPGDVSNDVPNVPNEQAPVRYVPSSQAR